MDVVLLVVAWAAGLTSLFLVGDMIASDFVNRRAEARQIDPRYERENHRTARPRR
jgi:hypothetical protein